MADRVEGTPDSFNDEETRLAAVTGSYLRGLRRRYENNKTIIALWREYGKCARSLRREYRGREDEAVSGMVANWITASSLAEASLNSLLDEQASLDREIATLHGQLELFANSR